MESSYLQYLHDKERFPRFLVHGPIRRFFRRYLEAAASGSPVLDAGCGNGIETGPYAGRLRVHGVDYQKEYVTYCAATYPAAHYAVGDLLHLGLAEQSFDLVVMNQVIEHLAEPARAVTELARVLRPGGRLLVATPNYGGCGWPLVENTFHRWIDTSFDARENHLTHYRTDTLREQLGAALEVEYLGTVCGGLILVGAGRRARAKRRG